MLLIDFYFTATPQGNEHRDAARRNWDMIGGRETMLALCRRDTASREIADRDGVA